MAELLTFGTQSTGVNYIRRPGAYAVFFNEEGELGIMKTDDQRYFLGGGGIEEGEEKEEALLRELMEEAGIEARVGEMIGVAKEFYLDELEGRYYEKIGHFYTVSITGINPEAKIEMDHTLIWLPAAKALPLLYHDMYRWAVKQAQL
ncbi:MAG: NUDIX domain-containing protein [Phaeodactylibacter sp.]|nr:NUDIX domain-containing protein [Phaeodactylibacter sp.]